MDEKERFLGHLRKVHLRFSRFYARVLAQAGISLPQYALLNELAHAESMPMTEVSGRLHITKPAVTHLVDRLEKAGLLKRVPYPKDRRVYLVEIQPRGRQLVREAQEKALNIFLKTLAQFSNEERKIMGRFYELLAQVIDDILAKNGGKS
ncbi:MAG TPA: MarR family transcriptional regulator [Candidatus Omnitrophota bacterium]|nr:MarR family transcriptional regulator [Candidatus Omnitrophota bacterium]